jgi:hypothetical protein
MAMIYYCKTCGSWKDIHFLWWLSTQVDKLAEKVGTPPPARPDMLACPQGHGPMVALQPTDCIQLRETSPGLTLLHHQEPESEEPCE